MEIPDTLALWPPEQLSADQFAESWQEIASDFRQRLGVHQIPEAEALSLAGIYLPLASWIHQQRRQTPWVVGINGAQGSGKSTLCDFLPFLLQRLHGDRSATLSIDDLYLTRSERARRAREIHPLLITRGVPGTHDTALGLETLERLERAGPDHATPLPRFDKARDDREPCDRWPRFVGRPDIILLEGWCVGTPPQHDQELIQPINSLEAQEDPDGRWRRFVNQQLKQAYARLFDRIDTLILLEAPDMESVFEWRSLQERKLASRTALHPGANRIMDEAALHRFIQHYERLTRQGLKTLPSRADLTLSLDRQHRLSRVAAHHHGRSGRSRLAPSPLL